MSSGVLLVGHGTRDKDGTREFFALVSVLAEQLAPIPVEGCLLEFQHPTIPEAWRSLIERGVNRIRVAPLLLFAAGHARSDIPEIVAECSAASPGVRYEQAGPLSRAAPIVELAAARITEAARNQNLLIDESVGLVMAGRGSYDPCAKADMRILGEIVASRVGLARHRVGFYAMAEPRLPEVLDKIAVRPDTSSVIVQPHLLFQGRLYDAIARQVAEAAERHRQVKFVLGNYLGPTSKVAEAVVARAFPAGLASLVSGTDSRQAEIG